MCRVFQTVIVLLSATPSHHTALNTRINNTHARTYAHAGKSLATDIDWKQSYRFALPGFLYAVTNNMVFAILLLLPPAVFQITANIKVVWTALLFSWLLARRYESYESCRVCTVHALQLLTGTALSYSRTLLDAFSNGMLLMQWHEPNH